MSPERVPTLQMIYGFAKERKRAKWVRCDAQKTEEEKETFAKDLEDEKVGSVKTPLPSMGNSSLWNWLCVFFVTMLVTTTKSRMNN